MAKNVVRHALLTCGTAITLIAAAPALAQQRTFNVPTEPATQSIPEFARQAGIQIIAPGAVLRNVRTPALRGSYDVREALAILLNGTGLRIVADEGSSITLGANQSGEGQAVGAPAANESAEQQAIVVTGTNLRGVKVAAPTITLGRQDFAQGGFTSTQEVFEKLPQNFAEVTPGGRFANEGGSLLRGLNNERVTAVDLRGLGAQSTLTLLNGVRQAGSVDGRVVDISVIPLSVIERIEIVTGGRSAIYGADAVAGVVNLVTRRTFDGAESQASVGFAEDGGGENLQLSQMFGIKRERGGFVAAYDFAREWPLDLADVGLLSLTPNPEIGLTQLSLQAQSPSWRHSAFVSGKFDVSPNVELFGDALYSRKKFHDFSERLFEGATENSFTDVHNKAEHFSVTGGTRVGIGEWSLKLTGAHSQAKNDQDSLVFVDLGFISLEFDSNRKTRSNLSIGSAVAEGPLLTIGELTPRVAVGAEVRREGFRSVLDGEEESDDHRTVKSLFGELLLPLAERGGDGLRSLEVTVAGRYDHYSDFGGTFNPQAGVRWEPLTGLTFRGAYSRAYRAPALSEKNNSVEAFLELATDPSGGGLVPVLFIQGAGELGPEKAKTWTLGVDYSPPVAPWLRTSLNYFDVKYNGRIEQPSVNADRELILERAARFPGLLTLMPTAAQATGFLDLDADGFISNDTGIDFDPATQNILNVFPNLVLFDNRVTNIAIEQARGIDFTADATFETGAGRFDAGVNFTHTFDHKRRVTSSSPAFSLLNEVGKPVDTRARVRLAWTKGAIGVFGFVNYFGDYRNPFSDPPSRMGSWTTVDLTLRFLGSKVATSGPLNGLDVAVTVKNLFDNDPPRFNGSLLGVLYDSTNANPFGRHFTLRLTKRW